MVPASAISPAWLSAWMEGHEINLWGVADLRTFSTPQDEAGNGFPHKTAATLAGLGWIGRHCQLVTRPFGPWVRLGTVFTDMELSCGPSKERSYCGICSAICPYGINALNKEPLTFNKETPHDPYE